MDDNSLTKTWPNSQLNTAISCLTYGINCLYFDRVENQLRSCLLSIHEEYINIVHVIIENRVSFLFELQHIKSISNRDIFVRQTLKSINYEYFIIVYTSALQSHVLVMHSENEINVLWEGLQYFAYQAQNFYSRISENDPFKAETTMLFMDADADGSKLLDISEVMQIFHKLKINKEKKEIEQAVRQINLDLYEKQNLKKPKDFSLDKLTPLGFEYILQFYSLKASLAPLFTQFCPIFKFKHKQFKKSIIDILKSQTKPLMSSIQLQEFLNKYMKMALSEYECTQLIKTFPIYDGEGKEIPEQIEYLSFHNFCNFVFSQRNSLMDPQKTEIYQDMSLPLNEYFVYSSCMAEIQKQNDSQLQLIQFALKKGCRCIQIDIHVEKEQIVVKYSKNKKFTLLSDVLKTVKNIAFSFNHFPVIISIECNFLPSYAEKVAHIFKTEVAEALYVLSYKDSKENEPLPSPEQLKDKIILQLIGNTRKSKEEQNAFTKLVALMPTKLDFERKGLTNWDTCQISTKDIVKHEEIENKNLTDYSRKIIVRTSATEINGEIDNYDPMPMFRNGIQLIAQNIQKEDSNQYFVHSKFIQNGGRYCGYLQKPVWMRSNCLQSLYATNFSKQQWTLKIKVYAGQKYVLTDTESQNFNLEISLKGTKIEQQKNKKFVSEVQNEGFYADFEMEGQFYIFCVDLAVITFSIVNEKHQILSYRAIPVNSIREGLRTVSLLGPGMELHINSCFLVEATIIQQKAKKKIATLLL